MFRHTERFANIVPMPLREQIVGTFHSEKMWVNELNFDGSQSARKYRHPLPFREGFFHLAHLHLRSGARVFLAGMGFCQKAPTP